MGDDLQLSTASDGKTPRRERASRKILDTGRAGFGEQGFSDGLIVAITQCAGVTLGTFYTHFDSRDARLLRKGLVA